MRVVVRVDDVAFANGLWGGIMVRGDCSVVCVGDLRMMAEFCWATSPVDGADGSNRSRLSALGLVTLLWGIMASFGSYRITLSVEEKTGETQLARSTLNAYHQVLLPAKWERLRSDVCAD